VESWSSAFWQAPDRKAQNFLPPPPIERQRFESSYPIAFIFSEQPAHSASQWNRSFLRRSEVIRGYSIYSWFTWCVCFLLELEAGKERGTRLGGHPLRWQDIMWDLKTYGDTYNINLVLAAGCRNPKRSSWDHDAPVFCGCFPNATILRSQKTLQNCCFLSCCQCLILLTLWLPFLLSTCFAVLDSRNLDETAEIHSDFVSMRL